MILDDRTEFADASTAVQAGAGTVNVGDVIDLTAASELGSGQPVYLVITVDSSIITAGAAGTIAFQLVSDASGTIATDGTQSVHFRTKTYVTDDDALNELDAGAVLVFPLPTQTAEVYERYLALQAVIATTTVTGGAVSAFLTLDPAGWKAYANATGE